ncbi:hypothetical protein V500_00647 [Pseudogymnoascus sp. VKM F-4518 (FW-2643)]|nr:hypothetical protein V500_00647 [Pseudogymnoascus sp. VKM F-4518 (FW-2643)]
MTVRPKRKRRVGQLAGGETGRCSLRLNFDAGKIGAKGNAGAAINSDVLDVDISRVALKGHRVVTALVDLVGNGDVVGAIDVDAVGVLDVMFAAAAVGSRLEVSTSTAQNCCCQIDRLQKVARVELTMPTIHNIIATCNPPSCGLVLEVEAVRVLDPVRQVVGEVQRAADFERRVLEMRGHALVDAVHVRGREHNAAAGDGATLVHCGEDVGHVVLAVPKGDHYAGFVVVMIMTLTMMGKAIIRCHYYCGRQPSQAQQAEQEEVHGGQGEAYCSERRGRGRDVRG